MLCLRWFYFTIPIVDVYTVYLYVSSDTVLAFDTMTTTRVMCCMAKDILMDKLSKEIANAVSYCQILKHDHSSSHSTIIIIKIVTAFIDYVTLRRFVRIYSLIQSVVWEAK